MSFVTSRKDTVTYSKSTRLFRRGTAVAALATIISVPTLKAATGVWGVDGAAGWSNAANWTGGIVPNGIDDVANFTFDIFSPSTITLDGTRTVGSMTVGDLATPFNAYTFSANGQGGRLIFDVSTGSANLTFAATSTTQNVLNVPLLLNDNLTIHALNNNLTAGGNIINGNISGAGGLTLTADGTHPADTASGVGYVALTGYNTFSGGLTAEEGTIRADNAFALGTGAVTIKNNGQVWLNLSGTVNNNITVNGLGWNIPTHGPYGALRSDGTTTFTGSITLGSDSRFQGVSAGNNTISGVIGETNAGTNLQFNELRSGAAASASTWVFNNTNTYTGKTTVNSGTLRIGTGGTTGSLGATSALEFANANIEFRRSDNVTVTTPFTQLTGTQNGVAITGSNLIHSGTGVLTLNNGASAYIGATTVNGTEGKLVLGTGGAYSFSGLGTVTLSNGADIEFNTSSAVNLGTVTLAAADAGKSFVIQSGSGTATLGGAADNAFAGAIVNGGTLVLGKASTASVHAIGSNANLNLIVNNGTLQLGGTGGDQIHTNTDVQVNGGTFDLNGTNEGFDVLTGNGGVVTNTKAASTSTLTLGENNSSVSFTTPIAYNSTYGGVIKDGAGAAVVAVTKAGTGLQTLSGANTYSGLTTVNAGALSVTGSTLSTGAVNVNTGGTLSGTGSVGNVTLLGTGAIRPGATNLDTATGTLTLNGLTVSGGDIRMNLGTSSDRVNVTGTASFNGISTLTPTFSALPTIGTTTLVNATGGLAAATLPTLTVPATTRSTFALSTTANTLDLVVSGASAKSLTWTGGGSGNWDLNTSSNFDASGAEKFFNLDAVTFGDGPVNRTVTLAAGLTPTSVTVNNSTGNDYTFQTGSIAGGGTSLTKSGSGTLFLNTANTFSGPVTITGGTLKAGNATALGDANGQTFVSGGATLDVNGLNLGAEVINISGAGVGGLGALVNNSATAATLNRTVTLTGNATIGGTGRFDFNGVGSGVVDLAGFTLTKVGTNLVYLTNSSGVSQLVTNGNIDVQGGILGFAFTGTAVNGTGTITYNPGTTGYFYQTTVANITRDIVVNGATFQTQAQTSAVGSNIRLTGNLTVDDTGGSLTLAGNITESGGARSLIKANAGGLTLNGNNTFTGGITSTGGTINLGGTNTVSGPVNLTSSTLQVLGTPTTNASLGNASSISLSSSTLTLNLPNNYTLPATTLSSANSSTINFAGQSQGTTLTINSPLGSTTDFNTLFLQQGTAILAGGANVTVSQLNVGVTALGSGNIATLNIQPGATVTTRNFYIGEGANGRTGIVNQTGGTVNILGTDPSNDGSFRLGHWNGSGATYNLSGGTLNVPNTTTAIGVDGVNPSFNISGGTANLYRLLVDGRSATAGIGGTLNLSGGELVIGAGGLGTMGNGQVNLSGGTLAASAPSTWSAGMNFANDTATLDTRGNNVILTGGLNGPGGFTKTGGGRLTLANLDNPIAGTINANAGQLFITGALSSPLATLNVNSGATLILDATGFGTGINGKVTINGGGVLTSQGIGTASMGSLTMNGGAARFELDPNSVIAGNSTNDLVAVTGALSFGSGATIIPSFTGLQTGGKVYTLFTSGTRTGLPVVDANAAVSRLTYAVGSTANGVTLSVTGTAKALTWTGANGSTWDLTTTANFSASGSEKFFQQDAVTFAGAAPGTITLAGVLQPSTVTVNSTADYTFAGPGSIDTGSLTKSGTGSLTLTGVNNYASGTAINGGTLAFANGSLGSSGAITMNGGTLRWHGTNTEDVSSRISMVEGVEAKFDTNGNTVTFANPIGSFVGAGLTKTGAGTLALNGVNSYIGATTVNGGTLSVGNGISAASIDPSSVVSIGSGATMKWNSAPTTTGVTLSNQISGAGTLVFQGQNATNGLQISTYDLTGDNSGLTGTIQINRSILWNTLVQSEIGSAAIDVQEAGTISFNGTGATFSNKITVGQGAGWHHNQGGDVLLGGIRLEGSNTLTGDIVLNNTASVILGDNTGANSTIGGWGAGDQQLTGVISGPGDFAMSRYTANGGAAGTATIIRFGGSTSNTYTGKTVVDGQGNRASLWLEKTGGAVAIPGNTVVQMGNGTASQANLRMGQNEQFGAGVVMNFVNANGQWMRFDLKGTTQTLAGINSGTSASTTQAGAVIQNQGIDAVVPAADATLTLNGSGTYYYYGYLRDQDNSQTAKKIGVTKSGTGTQTLAGSQIIYTGPTVVSGGKLVLQDTTAFASPITNNAAVEITGAANSNFNANAAWDGSGTWLKTGTGAAILNRDANALTGGITVNGGELQAVVSTTAGAKTTFGTGDITVNSGATLRFKTGSTANGISWANNINLNNGTLISEDGNQTQNGTVTLTGSNTVNIVWGNKTLTLAGVVKDGASTGSLIKTGADSLILTGANTYTGGTTINSGTLAFGTGGLGSTGAITMGGGTLKWNGSNTEDVSARLAMVNGATATFDTNGNTVTFGSSIGNSASGAVTKAGTGTLILTGGSNYTGLTTISGGTLQIGNGGTSGSLSSSGDVLNNAELAFNRSDALAVSNRISGTGTLTKNGTGTLTLTGTNTYTGSTTISSGALQIGNGGTSGTLGAGSVINNASLVFNRSDALAVSSVISGTGTLTKTGSGTVTLSGANTYTGATAVNNGALLLNGGALDPGSPVALASGATFGGKGTAGAVTVSAGGIVQGGIAGAGSLALGSLTFGGSGALNFTPNSGSTAQIAVTGAVTTSGTETINILGAPLANGSYRLLSYGSLAGAGIGAFTLGTTPQIPGARSKAYTLDTTTAPGSYIALNVAAEFLIWAGGNNGNWDTSTANNWKLGSNGNADKFIVADDVRFNDTTGTRNVVISGTDVAPGSVVFNNSTGNDYTLTGTNGIAGGTSLVKNGAGTVTIANNNSYTGDTTISAGTLQVGNGGTAGTLGSGTVIDNASLVFNRSDSPTVSNKITGTGSVTKAGSSSLTLIGSNDYSGGTVISGGMLQIGNGSINGTVGTGNYSIAKDASLYLNYATAAAPTWSKITGAGTLRLGSAQAVNGTADWGTVALPAGFTGTLALDKGRINALPADLGGTSNVIVADGAQFLAFVNGGGTYTYPQNLSISGMGWGETNQNLGALRVSAINATFSGGITLTAPSGLYTQSGTGTMNVTGVISDGGNNFALTTNAAGGAITFSNSGNSYAGNTIVNSGTLKLGASNVIPDGPGKGNVTVTSTLDLNGFSETVNGLTGAGTVDNVGGAGASILTVGGNDTTASFTGVIKNTTGTVGLVKTGAGTLTLTGANTYTGTTTLSSGTLALNTNNLNSTAGYIINDANTGASDTTLKIFGGFSTNRNGLTTTVIRDISPVTVTNNGTGTTTLDFDSSTSAWITGLITIDKAVVLKSASGGGIRGGFVTISGNGAGAGNDSVIYDASGSGNDANWNTYEAPGDYVPAPNTYSGNVRFTGGATIIQNKTYANAEYVNMSIPDTASVKVDAGSTLNFAWGAESFDGLNDGVGGGGNVLFGGGGTAPTITIGASNGSGAFSGVISSALSLTKTGTGTQVLSGTNTYTGGTTVNGGTLLVSGSINGSTSLTVSGGGTLKLGASNALKDTATVTLDGGTLATGGFSDTIGALTLNVSSTIDLGSAASILHFADSSASFWSGDAVLKITNWSGSVSGGGTDQLYFGSDANGIGFNLAAIQFVNPTAPGFAPGTYGAQILPTGEIVAVIPEPGVVSSLLGGIGLLVGMRRRRTAR